ncbi:hypothetical protein [Desulfuromonas soudanensis]|uniref:hypothetical protein n=1 Tax=Desulfuromonas soudanensis TaxID=1603606 RepID=UPI0012FCAAD6|nr:hypothetical protein [Desulfuromonas soudanensis]
MKIFVFLTILLLVPLCCSANENECPAKGDVLHWVADYCMYLAETDDFGNENVQSCFEKEQAFKIDNTCENRMKYKKKLCNLSLVRDSYTSVEECYEDKSFSGPTVRNGGV